MRNQKIVAHAHLVLICAGASYFVQRMRISFSSAQAHPILFSACASHFYAHAYLVLVRVCPTFSRGGEGAHGGLH